VALVRERTMPTDRPTLVGEDTAKFCGERFSKQEPLLFLQSSSSITLLLKKSGSAENRARDL
jgi:hypothetical protein